MPLPYSGTWKGNTWDFSLSDNIQSANCFHRQANEMPWSSFIRSAKCEYVNKKYNPKVPFPAPTDPHYGQLVAEGHGQYVWSNEVIDLVKASL